MSSKTTKPAYKTDRPSSLVYKISPDFAKRSIATIEFIYINIWYVVICKISASASIVPTLLQYQHVPKHHLLMCLR